MAAEKDDFFDDDEEQKPKIIVQKKLPPQTETMDLPEKEPKQKMPRKKKEPLPEAAPAAEDAKPAEKAVKPKPAASHAAKKMRAVNISEDTYWAIRKKLVDLRKETPVDEVLEEAVRLWIRHKSG